MLSKEEEVSRHVEPSAPPESASVDAPQTYGWGWTPVQQQQQLPLLERGADGAGGSAWNEKTIDEPIPNVPPPSYASLYGELKTVRTPRRFFEILHRFLTFILNTFFALVAIAFLSIIPIAMIVIGSMTIYKCPAQRYIPIYLVVGGCFGLFHSLLHLPKRIRDKCALLCAEAGGGTQREEEASAFDGLLYLFHLAWFIAGSVWVYRAYQPNFDPRSSSFYCDGLCYWFAFYLITVTYGLVVLVPLLLCFCGCCLACLADDVDEPAAVATSEPPAQQASPPGADAERGVIFSKEETLKNDGQ